MSLNRLLDRGRTRDLAAATGPRIRNQGGDGPTISYVVGSGTTLSNGCYLQRGAALTGAPSTTTELTVSCWIQLPESLSWENALFDMNGRDGMTWIDDSGENLQLSYRASNNSIFVSSGTSGGDLSAKFGSGVPFHLCLSIDAVAGTFKVWADGVLIGDLTPGTATLGNWSDWFIGSDNFGTRVLGSDVAIGDFWMNYETVASPVGVFIDGSGNPLSGGLDGSEFTGSDPLIYITGGADVWNAGTNAGTGGNFTKTGEGSFADA